MVSLPSSTHSRPYAAALRLVCAVVPLLAMWIGLNTFFRLDILRKASRRVRTLRLRLHECKRQSKKFRAADAAASMPERPTASAAAGC